MGIEIWRTVIYDGEIYEGFEVSNWGRIKSLNYRHTGKFKLMSPIKDKDGYFKIQLWKNRKRKTCLVHRLVAEVFIPNPDNLPQVNHRIEGDKGKTINMVFFNEDGSINKEKSTIEWCDHTYNINYGTRNERAGKAISKAKINGKCSKKVLQFTLDGDFIREWESISECGRNGFDKGAVWRCCNGKLKQYKGFIWRYKKEVV